MVRCKTRPAGRRAPPGRPYRLPWRVPGDHGLLPSHLRRRRAEQPGSWPHHRGHRDEPRELHCELSSVPSSSNFRRSLWNSNRFISKVSIFEGKKKNLCFFLSFWLFYKLVSHWWWNPIVIISCYLSKIKILAFLDSCTNMSWKFMLGECIWLVWTFGADCD